MKFGLLFFVVCAITQLSRSETNDDAISDTKKPERMSRKYYDAEIYTGNDDGETFGDHRFRGVPRSVTVKKHVIPYRHAGSAIMKKSGNNINWNVWKGENDDSVNEDSDDADVPKWQHAPQGWGNDATWVADPMYIMMLKNAMAEIKGENKPTGFLSKITSDPALLLIAASIPISLLLAAVIPAIVNLVANGSNVPVISTTATGSKSRSSQMDIVPYLAPVMEAIGSFGVRSINDPDCMQRIFCQVAQEKASLHDSKYLRKAATIAKYLANGNWLENFGVKDLVESLSNGNCENIPCSHSTRKETLTSKYPSKDYSNSVKK